jgi:hypothetical protein
LLSERAAEVGFANSGHARDDDVLVELDPLAGRELPKKLHLRIEHDGLALVDQDLTAEYTVSQPNGPDCGPVCCSASDAVVLSFDRAP